jgi:hypothetical protein
VTTRLDYDHEESIGGRSGKWRLPAGYCELAGRAGQKWLSDNTAAILADSDPLVGCDRLDENDFLTDIGKGWNDPEFLAGAKAPRRMAMGIAGRSSASSNLLMSSPANILQ